MNDLQSTLQNQMNQEEMSSTKHSNQSLTDWKSCYSSTKEQSHTNGGNRRDLLILLKQLEVDQKYIDIQAENQYNFEEIEKLSEEEFAQKFQAENSSELNMLADILLKLKSLALPESYEIQRNLSISVSEDTKKDTLTSRFGGSQYSGSKNDQLKSNGKSHQENHQGQQQNRSGFFGTFSELNNFNTQSQYLYSGKEEQEQKDPYSQYPHNYNPKTSSLNYNHPSHTQFKDSNNQVANPNNLHPNYRSNQTPHNFRERNQQRTTSSGNQVNLNSTQKNSKMFSLESKLGETLFYHLKQLPYDPFEYISPASSTSGFKSNLNEKNSQFSNSGNTQREQEDINVSSMNEIAPILNQIVNSIMSRSKQEKAIKSFKDTITQPHLFLRVQTKDEINLDNLSKLIFPSDKLSIGRSNQNTMQLQGNSISRFHALLEAKSDCYLLSDKGSGQGTFVKLPKNGIRLLTPGQNFRCGDTEFKVTKQIIEEKRNCIVIQIVQGSKKNTNFEFQIVLDLQNPCFIGTISPCKVRVIDQQMETIHARIFLHKNQAFLEDLSTTGTWLRLSQPKELSNYFRLLDGQQFQIGPYVLTSFFFL